MITILVLAGIIYLLGNVIGLGFKITFGILGFFIKFLFLPLIIVGLIIGGLFSIALPVMVILGIVMLISSLKAV